jgi:ABC-type lipoprotein export system ATPase subunit
VTPVLALSNIQKAYHSLRPLRIKELTVAPAERVAVTGLEAGGSEVLVNLVTGASLPDQGEVRVLGRPTSEIANGDEWLASLDRFGIVSPRSVLVDPLSIAQNIAMVFTLEIEPVPPGTAARVAALASACGISDLDILTGEAGPEVRARIHLARAVALEPALLILEHLTAGVPEDAKEDLVKAFVSIADARGLAALILTQDEDVARRSAHRALRLEPATGALKPVGRGWFR